MSTEALNIVIAMLVTIGGIWSQNWVNQFAAEVEDQIKDHRITDMQARRKMRFWRLASRLITIFGMVLLVLAFYHGIKR